MKSISTIDQAFTEDMKCSITKVHTPLIDLNIGSITVYHCASFPDTSITLDNNIRNA